MEKEILESSPLICDPAEGVCGIPAAPENTNTKKNTTNGTVKLIYFTDPICSSCWGIEPQLRKLKLEYGDSIEIDYRMGGLLPDWSYSSGSINQPADVARHWDEVSQHYDMPIDSDVWLEDPLHSSYPPSIAFKAAQLQDKEKAILFLRTLREMLFLQKKNIAKWEHISAAAEKTGLDPEQLKKDFEGSAKKLFEEDLELARKFRVRGFPTLFFVDAEGNQELVYGTKPYVFYEIAVLKSNPGAIKKEYSKDWKTLFSKYDTLTAREFSELSGTSRNESEKQLEELSGKGLLEKLSTKNGAIWKRK